MVLNLEIALNGLKALNVLSTRKNPILVELFDAVNDELITDTCLKHAKIRLILKLTNIWLNLTMTITKSSKDHASVKYFLSPFPNHFSIISSTNIDVKM